MRFALRLTVITLALVLALALSMGGCALLTPLPGKTTTDDRLSVFPRRDLPLAKPVTIRWNAYQVPHIEAQDDLDAAFALGLVHAHLRLAQMEILKRVAYGRISEMLGPIAVYIDAAIRTLGFARAAGDILAAMPEESRRWLERYTQGINIYRARLRDDQLPHEFTLLALEREPWLPQDSIAVGRLGGTDINWLTYLLLLPLKDDPSFADLWATVKRIGNDSTTSFEVTDTAMEPDTFDVEALRAVARLGVLLGRTGSNSIVVAPERSATGAALIANDPHLGFMMPNLWLIAGLNSPSDSIVGMMLPGTPTFGFGRTPHIAWGGTNMRSLNSDFVDLSGVPETAFQTREEVIEVRFWFDRTIRIRTHPYGPVLSDTAVFEGAPEPFAVRWIGHDATDEVTALLKGARARSWREFKDAFGTFAIPAQNFLVADTQGNIAQITATQLPNRRPEQFDDILTPPETVEAAWRNLLTTEDLPYAHNPPSGFLASANNRPAVTEAPIGIFFTPDERIRRLKSLLDDDSILDLEKLSAIQQDVYSPLSAELRDAIVARLDDLDTDGAGLDLLRAWDGRYEARSKGALAFEAFLEQFAPAVFEAVGRGAMYELFGELAYIRSAVREFLPQMSDAALRAAAKEALAAADKVAGETRVWGDIHRLAVQHPLGFAPLIGGRYRFGDMPVSGSRETIMKTSHTLTTKRHNSFYGSQSRHLSDLSDPDANYFVLFGGQDGWINSANFADQVDLWRRGRFIEMPLTPGKIRALFPYVMHLTPEEGAIRGADQLP